MTVNPFPVLSVLLNFARFTPVRTLSCHLPLSEKKLETNLDGI